MFIRALIFFFGLLMLSTGISVITHAGLGTGTISSVALVLSKALPLSMGFFVFLTNVFFFVLQTAVDPSRFLVKLVKQIPICFVFGLFFDAAYALTSFVAPAAYLEQLATVFIGTVFNGMGIAGMVFARLAILPPEGLVISIIRRWGGSFGNLRPASTSSSSSRPPRSPAFSSARSRACARARSSPPSAAGSSPRSFSRSSAASSRPTAPSTDARRPATYLASTVLRRSSTPAMGSASESALTRSSTMSGTGRTSGADALKNAPSCVRSFATLPQ